MNGRDWDMRWWYGLSHGELFTLFSFRAHGQRRNLSFQPDLAFFVGGGFVAGEGGLFYVLVDENADFLVACGYTVGDTNRCALSPGDNAAEEVFVAAIGYHLGLSLI